MGNSDHGTTHFRVGWGYRELRPWHYIYVYSTKGRTGGVEVAMLREGKPNAGRMPRGWTRRWSCATG